ncbi:MAG: dihydropteroate synthase [Burkholderiaceae bacterium]|jgi:dihydropteroate synthase|nr:dihydropteroate synthase [Burkholderiaceae bacterium]
MPVIWQTTRYRIDLSAPRIMGIVNTSPDSFSDGGQHADLRAQLAHCERLIGEGADILDIGGVSTRPGSLPVPLAEELARVLPLVREAVKLGVPVSVDTGAPEVMAAVLDAGADIINDVWALRRTGQTHGAPTALDVAAHHPSCGLCLMHMHGDPQTMQAHPMTDDAVSAVLAFLRERRDALTAHGIARDRIVLDPGIGFGKTVAQNFALLARQRELLALGQPLLVGWSRKSALGAALTLRPPRFPASQGALPPEATPAALERPGGGGMTSPRSRDVASVAAALLAIERGARIVRVHDVRATTAALAIWQSMREQAQLAAGTPPSRD